MSNTDNQSVKAEIINNVIVAMTYYLSSDVLEMLEKVLTKNLVDVVIETNQYAANGNERQHRQSERIHIATLPI